MKFYCESCNTKYAISDEKVRGKVLKVRCKKCENIITVREARAPESAPVPAAPETDGIPQSNWYFAINGVTTGPLGIESLRAKLASGEVGDEAYVWHDSFDKWEPVATVDAFADSLAKGQKLQPRAKTLGFTGKLEAVKAPEGPNRSKEGTVPAKKETVEQEPAAAEPAARPDSDGNDVRKDKLAALRAKLDKKKSDSKPTAKLPEREPVAAEKPKLDLPKAPEEEPKQAPAVVEEKPKLSKPLATPPSPSQVAAAAEPKAPIEELEADADESEEELPTFAPTPSTTSTSDIFDVPASLDEDDEADDEADAVPFFPAAAANPAAPAEQSALTGSLLIQLDQIQKKSRGSKFIGAAVILFVLVAVAGVTIYIVNQDPLEEGNFAKAEGPGSGEHRELNFRTYSNDDQKKILELGDEEILMEFGEDEAGEVEGVAAKGKPSGVTIPVEKKKPSKTEEAPAEVEPKEERDEGKTLAMARIKSPEEDTGKPTAESTKAKAERFRSATSTVKARTTDIARPQDKLSGDVNPNATLSREQALEGMKKVSRSVQLCRERHMRRGGAFDSPKIFVTVTVNGDGRVGEFEAEPKSLQSTEFGRCMNSHKGRWRFAAFGGKPQQVRRRFIIQ